MILILFSTFVNDYFYFLLLYVKKTHAAGKKFPLLRKYLLQDGV